MVQPESVGSIRMNQHRSIILTGPTAVGKSSFSIQFALKHEKITGQKIEIINADSVCFYQEFNIGSAKPTEEELQSVPHHLINVAHPNEVYHAGEFLRTVKKTLAAIHARGNRALIVGGSGFYLKALRLGLWDAPPTSLEFRDTLKNETIETLHAKLKTIDPVHAEKIGTNDRYRAIRALEIFELSGKKSSELEAEMPSEPNSQFELWILDRDKEELSERMRVRIAQMLEQGLVEEAKNLREKFPESKTLRAVGYHEVLQFLDGVKPQGRKIVEGLPGLVSEIELSHRQLAKQQRTWFKNLKPEQSFTLDRDLNLLKEKLMSFYQ
jgi:tRNA dimethylallyltransferase